MKILIYIGWLIVAALAALMLYAIYPQKAHAEVVPAYELVIATYPSDHGHTISLRSYIDIYRLPYPDADACEDAREYAAAHHEPYRDPRTMAVHLTEMYCIKNPRGKP
jgi:hypothetical protein